MRDIVLKNLTSDDKKRKILTSSEIMDKQGVRSIIRRHFVCMVKEVKGNPVDRPLPYLYVLKKHNNREHKEKFFCRLKGSIYAICNDRIFLIMFMHSLKIDLIGIPDDSPNYSEEDTP